MKKIIFVTSNKGKIATAQKDLKNIKVLSNFRSSQKWSTELE